MTEAGVGELVDFMPVASSTVASSRHRLVRLLRCVRGEMTFAVDIAPRFDYGREPHETHLTEDGIVFEGKQTSMTVNLVKEPDDERLGRFHVDEQGDFHAEVTLACRPDARPGAGDRHRRTGPAGAGGRGVAAVRRHGAVLGVLAGAVDVRRDAGARS